MKKIFSILLLLFVCSAQGQTLRLNALRAQQSSSGFDRPTFISNTGNQFSSNSLTLTKPNDVNSGDLLIIIVGNDNETNTAQWDNTTNKPSGFELIKEGGDTTSDSHMAMFWRIADGTEGATVDISAQSTNDYIGFYIHIAGTHQTTPIVAVGATNIIVSTNITLNGVTGGADDLGIYGNAFDGADGDPFSASGGSWIKREDRGFGSNVGVSGSFGTNIYSSISSQNATITSVGPSDGFVGWQIRIAPPD